MRKMRLPPQFALDVGNVGSERKSLPGSRFVVSAPFYDFAMLPQVATLEYPQVRRPVKRVP